MTVSCEWIEKNYKTFASRQEIGSHIVDCRKCENLTKSFFKELESDFDNSSKAYLSQAVQFRQKVYSKAQSSFREGMIDPSTAFLLSLCTQLYEDAIGYYKKYPHDGFYALSWLQKAFFLCRAFESEKYVERFETRPPKVGDMRVPGSDGKKFADVTSPSAMYRENLKYGTFQFNHELHDLILPEIEKGNYVHALKLICDAPKHGVMSSFLNVLGFTPIEHIYVLGFNAAIIAIDSFIKVIEQDNEKMRA